MPLYTYTTPEQRLSSKSTGRKASEKFLRGEPWFDDGNLVLIASPSVHGEAGQEVAERPGAFERPDSTEYGSFCENGPDVAFRVHRGVLARQSEVFREMLDIPQPPLSVGGSNGSSMRGNSADEEIEGCQVVRMYDHPLELANLLKAIYDGLILKNASISDFFHLAGILCLSTKYFIAHLRSQVLAYLTQTWSYTLKGLDTMVDIALRTSAENEHDSHEAGSKTNTNMSYPYVHPLHVLNLARSTNVRVIIPSALYFLSLYPLSDIVKCDHPKLLVEHPSKPSSALSYVDMQNYTMMFQHRINLMLDFIRVFCAERHKPSPEDTNSVHASLFCQNRNRQQQLVPVNGLGHITPTAGTRTACTQAFARLSSALSRSWKPRTAPLHWMLQAVAMIDGDKTVCEGCKRRFRVDVHKHREEIWTNLPGVVGLPGWEVLVEEDLRS